jgi:hypothetical protein
MGCRGSSMSATPLQQCSPLTPLPAACSAPPCRSSRLLRGRLCSHRLGCAYIHSPTHTHTHTCACRHTGTHTNAYMRMHTHTHTYILARTRIRTRTHTRSYIHTRTSHVQAPTHGQAHVLSITRTHASHTHAHPHSHSGSLVPFTASVCALRCQWCERHWQAQIHRLFDVCVGEPTTFGQTMLFGRGPKRKAMDFEAFCRYSVQHATCNVQDATWNVQRATCNVEHATCNVQCGSYSIQRATRRAMMVEARLDDRDARLMSVVWRDGMVSRIVHRWTMRAVACRMIDWHCLQHRQCRNVEGLLPTNVLCVGTKPYSRRSYKRHAGAGPAAHAL